MFIKQSQLSLRRGASQVSRFAQQLNGLIKRCGAANLARHIHHGHSINRWDIVLVCCAQVVSQRLDGIFLYAKPVFIEMCQVTHRHGAAFISGAFKPKGCGLVTLLDPQPLLVNPTDTIERGNAAPFGRQQIPLKCDFGILINALAGLMDKAKHTLRGSIALFSKKREQLCRHTIVSRFIYFISVLHGEGGEHAFICAGGPSTLAGHAQCNGKTCGKGFHADVSFNRPVRLQR